MIRIVRMSGVYYGIELPDDNDEAMEEIINAITDTAEVVDILKPLYNFKSH